MTEYQFTSFDLRAMQAWSLRHKLEVARNKIKEWYDYFHGNVYVAFSGGKDSTVLLDLVRDMYPDVPAVFVDTGLEYPEVRNFVKSFTNIEIIKPSISFKQVIELYGYPLISKQVAHKIYTARNTPNGIVSTQYFKKESEHFKKYGRQFSYHQWAWLKDTDIKIGDQCCRVMKKNPVKRYERKTKRAPFLALLAEESANRKMTWQKYGCNAFHAQRPVSNPLSIWTEQDILEYIVYFGIPYCSIYGEVIQDKNGKYKTTGVERTGCIYCGFGIHQEKEPNRFQKLKKSHPHIWNYCMKSSECGGLGMKDIFEKMNASGNVAIHYE